MNAVELIALYGNLFYVSVGIAVVGLGLAIFFFFYFDIPTVYALMTGKAKEDTIRRMAEQNAKTGNLRNPYGVTGKNKAPGSTGPLTQNVSQPVQHTIQSPVSDQTVPLAEPERYETSVLQTPVAETTILRDDAPETQILGYEPEAGATAVLDKAPYVNEPVAPAYSDFRFTLTENTLVIHTNEII